MVPVSNTTALNAVITVGRNNARAADSTGTGAAARPLLLHWNGTTWKHIPSPATSGGSLSAVAIHGRSGWAVGYTLTTHQALIFRWNGGRWTNQGCARAPQSEVHRTQTLLLPDDKYRGADYAASHSPIGGWHRSRRPPCAGLRIIDFIRRSLRSSASGVTADGEDLPIDDVGCENLPWVGIAALLDHLPVAGL